MVPGREWQIRKGTSDDDEDARERKEKRRTTVQDQRDKKRERETGTPIFSLEPWAQSEKSQKVTSLEIAAARPSLFFLALRSCSTPPFYPHVCFFLLRFSSRSSCFSSLFFC